MEQTQRKLGGNIAALRRAKGLTQEQLASLLGVSAPAVSKWETGPSSPLGVITACWIWKWICSTAIFRSCRAN